MTDRAGPRVRRAPVPALAEVGPVLRRRRGRRVRRRAAARRRRGLGRARFPGARGYNCPRGRSPRRSRGSGRASSTSSPCSSCPTGASLIGLLPVFLLIGVLGPILSASCSSPTSSTSFASRGLRSRMPAGPRAGAARCRRQADRPRGRAVLLSRRPDLPAEHDALRGLRRRADGAMPQVRRRPRDLDRHLRQLRARASSSGRRTWSLAQTPSRRPASVRGVTCGPQPIRITDRL